MLTDPFALASYDYELPEERIAQSPACERGASRLLVLDRHNQASAPVDSQFVHLPDFLPQGALLVANNSRVVPARLLGKRPTGGKVELLLLTPPLLVQNKANPFGDGSEARAEALLKPGKNIRVGDMLDFGPIHAKVLKKGDFGRHEVCLYWHGSLLENLEAVGSLPLPPYIKREQGPDDRARYQTLYARPDKSGSVAAPTAGLHFTPEMREQLLQRGFGWEEVTLHVGYGTFSPVRENDIRRHPMHGEYAEISPKTACAINTARKEGRPVIAVGTTSARTLEGASLACQAALLPEQGWQGWTNIFIYPGYEFKIIEGLITNFHLPQSSLLMLVSALAGRERILNAYALAIQEKYRFFSYGDAMLIR